MPLAALASCLLLARPQEASTWRQYAAPEEAGFSSAGLAEARALAGSMHSAAVFVVLRGRVLAAWGEVERRYECHSVRKSLVNALMGNAIQARQIQLTSTLAELGIDELEPLSAVERGARVVDLLAARSGVYHAAAKEPPEMRASRPARSSHAPGSFFFYNNWDFNLPGTLLERATGVSVALLFQEEIARPLGMEDFRAQDVCAELEPTRSLYPAHAFRLSARDLARFGELYRRHGDWNGHTLVPRAWIDESTRAHSDLGVGHGYGLEWWTYAAGALAEHPLLAAHASFAALGTGGQVLLVVPEEELVLVHRTDTEHGHDIPVRDVWTLFECILAARTEAPRAEPELGPLRVEPLPDPDPPLPELQPVTVDPAVFAGLAGEYIFSFSDASSVRVFVHAQRLFAHRSNGEEAELYPLSTERFFTWSRPLEFAFERDAAGRALSLRLRSPHGELVGFRRD